MIVLLHVARGERDARGECGECDADRTPGKAERSERDQRHGLHGPTKADTMPVKTRPITNPSAASIPQRARNRVLSSRVAA